ncbi:MAG TPA: HAMP domain-containing sensor histidine kinase [Thermomonospora sp.]|nr:HAMP domain-containing sensor histidine kinase [Thermomonospora sp.]
MRLLPSSVRARAALGAGAVVLAALVATGLAVLLVLRASLAREADLQAEVTARDVAAQVAAGAPPARLDLPDPDERPVQVLGADGRVLAADEDLQSIDGVGPADADDGDDESPGPGRVDAEAEHRSGRATADGETAGYRFAVVRAATPDGRAVTVVAGARPDTGAVGTVGRAMLAGLPVLLLVVTGVTWLVTRRALRPVEAIRAEMAEITASSDLSRRVPVPASRDEVADLAATTNETLAALERSVERQRRFVADASHELRSPIASLRTQLEVAAAHPHLLDTEGLHEDVVRLQHLAADLLLLARLDAGERPRPHPVGLDDLVRAHLAHRPTTDRVPVTFQAGTEDGPVVMGSRGRLEQVVGNLVDNAQRHAAGRVTVAVGVEGGEAVLRVADDGPGVPAAERERIFERFVRLDDARARDEGGAGLGLAIAREIVRAHGGDLTVRDAPGGGALFEARLPRGGGRG